MCLTLNYYVTWDAFEHDGGLTPLRASMNSREPSQPVRIKLFKAIRAVKLDENPGSSLRTPTGTLVEIPVGASVELEGTAGPAGLCNILWQGGAFSAFFEDLKENGHVLVT